MTTSTRSLQHRREDRYFGKFADRCGISSSELAGYLGRAHQIMRHATSVPDTAGSGTRPIGIWSFSLFGFRIEISRIKDGLA